MGDKYIGSSDILGFELTSEELRFVTTSETLSFELKSYDSSFPVYKIVLDFMDGLGGII